VTAQAVSVSANATGQGANRSGRVKGLVVNGQNEGTVTKRATYDLGGHGKLVVLDDRGRGVLGLRATLTSDYNNFPAGSKVKIAYAVASASDAVAAPQPKPSPAKPKPATPAKPSPAKPPKAKRKKPPRTKVLLTSKGYVFPVYGKHTYTDDWGAPRQDTGFHEGNDIFATAGTPLVAVCKGTLHRVGTNRVPGNRLWVKCDKGGDEFFYGHLSAFANDAHSGLHVDAGQVVGFVGSTGDAEQTPPHVHFEVHPGGGKAVDPYPFLRAWEHRRDVPAAAWVKANGAGAGEQPGTLVVVRDFLDR
jgi:murein DD-endopeptidase MepM/ murein hydrolase activator NlpD